jgi:LacI family transcriptional regulator
MTKRRQVAVILDSARPYHRKILLGIGAYAREKADWSLYLEDQPRERLPDLESWSGDGIIFTFADRHVVRTVTRLGLPRVGIEGGTMCRDSALGVPYFATDNEAIGRLAAEHLIERGFTRLAYCGYPRSDLTAWSVERAKAFEQAARERGLFCSVYTSRYTTARKWASLQRELTVWLASLEKPVGLLAANDARARHVLEACRSCFLRVPEDVAVLGVDNDEVMCELTDPPLSSIEQGTRTLGYQAAAMLDDLMAGKRVRRLRHFVRPKEVVMRRSTNVLAIGNSDVAAAVAYIRQHACDPASVGDVVAAVGLSRSTLHVRFKEAMGRTMHAEIQRVQIERARNLIAVTDLPLKQIATMAGFAHINYLTTVFRHQIGWTPAEYRKRARL